MRTSLPVVALVALACRNGRSDGDDHLSTPAATVRFEVSYDAEIDGPVLAWSTEDATSCKLDDHDVELSGADVPVAALDAPGFVTLQLVCLNVAGRATPASLRIWWGPDDELVVGGDMGITSTELLPLALVHGGLRVAGRVSLPVEEATPVFDVTRDLTIADGAGATSLKLELPVRDVYGDLVIEDDELTSLADYRPSRFRGGLVLRGAGSIDHLGTFPDDVATIPGDLTLVDNAHLGSLDGLDRVQQVVGDLQIVGNPLLTQLADSDDLGLSGLDTIGGSVVVQGNAALVDLWSRGSQLHTVGGSLVLLGNPALTGVKGLGGLTTIPGDLVVRDDDAIKQFPSLFLTEVGGDLVVRGNAELVEIGIFGALASVVGDVVVEENDMLPELDFLAALEAIGGSLSVTDDAALADVSGLGALTRIDGDAGFSGNPLLCPDEIDDVLADVTVGGLATNVGNGDDATCP